ncbi:MAG: hypothetical protein ABIS17_05540 [Casimicrobiaceae bacterium]
MSRFAVLLLVIAAAFEARLAHATFQTWRIETVYSSADGNVQFVVLRESANADGERFLAGRTLTSTHNGIPKTFTFPVDLPGHATAGGRLLVATPGFADLHFITPDYTVPAQFLATNGGTLDYAGVDQITYGALPTAGNEAMARTGSTIAAMATNFAGASVALAMWPVTAVEYYNLGLDHYFITDLQPDIDALDSGRIVGWSRTGFGFKVFPGPLSGTAPLSPLSPVCRFYIPPLHGDSHFFSASPAECAAVSSKIGTDPNYGGYILETPAAFHVGLPDTLTGGCPPGWVAVFRLWNQRADSNHRYTIDTAVKAQMITKSYVAEGYGPSATIMCTPAGGVATLRFLQGTSAANGALVSDGASVPAASSQGYATPTASVVVGPRRGNGEVTAFSERRAVTIQPASFATDAGDQLVDVALQPELAAPVTVWVVAGPFSATQQTALNLWATAAQIYRDERLGVSLPLEVIDATANPKAGTWNAFTCGATNVNVSTLMADVGSRPGRINVYLVGLVDGSTSRGNACNIGGRFVAIAAGAGADLLAHELGHDFALEHVDDLTRAFDPSNVMHSASNVRAFLTEGQGFRAHTRPDSALNAVYGLRPGLLTRGCDRDTLTVTCPPIAKRIWADGNYPAN